MSISVINRSGASSGLTTSIIVNGLDENSVVKATHKIPVLNPEWKVPEGYTQLEYIESTGTQYIDTGLASTLDSEYELKFRMNSLADQRPWGCYGSGGSMAIFYQPTVSKKFAINNSYFSSDVSTSIDYVFKANATTSSMNDETVNSPIATTTHSLLLMAAWWDSRGAEVLGQTSMRTYYYQHKIAGSIVRDMIPAKRNSDSVVGMYDLANDEFYTNAGTGEFIAGTEIPQYTDGFVDGKTKNGVWKLKPNPAAHGLPDGYTELEYIESTGTQYIITDVVPTLDTKVNLKLTVKGGLSNHAIFGAEWDTNGYFLMFYNNKLRWHSGGAYVDYGAYDEGNTISACCSTSYLEVDGIKTTISGGENKAQPIYIFATPDATSATCTGVFQLSYMQMRNVDNLVCNLVPAKRKSDNEIGLYDLVNNKFFTNAGTGEFIAGEEVPQYFAYHEIAKIKDLGTWTVEAINGEQTATQDVLVEAITQSGYEIEMDLSKLWLYRDGDQCTSVTGGWEKNNNASIANYHSADGTVVFGDDAIYTEAMTGNFSAIATTKQPVDISGYSKLKVLFGDINKFDNNVYMTKLNTGDFETTSTAQIRALSTSANTEMEVDISQYSGSYYFSVDSHSGRWAYFKRIWLE